MTVAESTFGLFYLKVERFSHFSRHTKTDLVELQTIRYTSRNVFVGIGLFFISEEDGTTP